MNSLLCCEQIVYCTMCRKANKKINHHHHTRSLAKTGLWRCKSARSAAHSACIGSFRLSTIASGPDQPLKAFYIENYVFVLLRPSKILIFF
jgi:hypothetical protein